MAKRIVHCCGCGNNITGDYRYDVFAPAQSNALSMWKMLVAERLDEVDANISAEDLLYNDEGTAGKICRLCSSALHRLHKLESSCRANIEDAVAIFIDSHDNRSSQSSSPAQSRKSRRDSSDVGRESDSPDVSVSNGHTCN